MTSTARLLAPLAALAAAVLVAAGPAGAATVAGTDVVASASFESCAQTVTILPVSMEPLDGNYTVWVQAQVYEPDRGWVVTDWTLVDGITSLMFYDVDREPYSQAYLTYARWADGDWQYASEWTSITDSLDNGFCPVS